jgi:taurine--2-oxoglutarate transaminase
MAPFNKYLRDHGLFTFVNGHIALVVPPLCITPAQLDEGLAVIEGALALTDAQAQRADVSRL